MSLFVAFGAASLAAPAFAQETGGGAPPPAGGNGSTAAPGLPALYGAPGVGAQSGAQKDINSYLPSSSQPRVGDKGDTFDLNRPLLTVTIPLQFLMPDRKTERLGSRWVLVRARVVHMRVAKIRQLGR